MALDRDELAARVLVAFASHHGESDPGDDAASFAVGWADALIARLRPATVAPVADAAPRPEWVRITSLPLGDDGRYPFAVGQVFKVAEWEDSAPRVIGPRREGITLSASGASIDPRHPGFATWEPCAAPAPSATAAKGSDTGTAAALPGAPPAAPSPAAYVPKVGDVVNTLSGGEARGFDATVVRERDADDAYLVHYHDMPSGEHIRAYGEPRYLRPATAAERAAAGLPPITPDHPQGGQGAEGDQRVAAGLDAPAKPAPAFDEAKERLAAHAAYVEDGAVVVVPHDIANYVAGWLARARIAANGGVA